MLDKSVVTKRDEFQAQIDWASVAQKSQIVAQLESMGRQTMNLRLMPDARLICLSTNGQLIGWGGLATKYNPEYPELFSLYVEPRYRSLQLGALIEYLRCLYLQREGIKNAFLRMTHENYWLLTKRTESNVYTVVDEENLSFKYTSMCRRCNIFGTSCQDQVFLRLNVGQFLERGRAKFGHLYETEFPSILKNLPI